MLASAFAVSYPTSALLPSAMMAWWNSIASWRSGCTGRNRILKWRLRDGPGWCGLGGQRNVDGGSPGDGGPYFDPAAVVVDDAASDGQAQPAAADRGTGASIKFLKNSFPFVHRDADAPVGYFEPP